MGVQIPEGVATPSTVVDSERLQRNIEAMASRCHSRGVQLRPHAKTHKCREIAALQMKAGAVGLSLSTVGEAESLTAEPAVDDIFIAYPLWADRDQVSRLEKLTDRVRLCCGADSVDAVRRLGRLAGRVSISVEVDCGLGRSGVKPEDAGALATAIAVEGFEVAGVFTFPGHSYAPGAGLQAAADQGNALALAAEVMHDAGFEHVLRSGGSTPTAAHASSRALDEIRPGVYVFNDAQQLELGVAGPEDIALVVAATVVSKPSDDKIVLDSGSKVLGPDRPAWTSGHGRLLDWPAARITGLWEHHAVVSLGGKPGPALGSVVAVVPNHVCTAVNLVSELLVAENGELVDRWRVVARGANR